MQRDPPHSAPQAFRCAYASASPASSVPDVADVAWHSNGPHGTLASKLGGHPVAAGLRGKTPTAPKAATASVQFVSRPYIRLSQRPATPYAFTVASLRRRTLHSCLRGECVATSSRRTPAEQVTGHQCDVESETVLPFMSTWNHRIMTSARCFSLPAMAVDGDFVVVSGHFRGKCTCFLTRPAVSTRHGSLLGSHERYSQRRPDVTVRNRPGPRFTHWS